MQGPATATARLRFEDFEVDPRCGELRRNGEKVKLQERPFQILTLLLERPGDVVTRREIQQRLWPDDTFVDFEHSINTAVNKLREALEDNVESPRFIQTVPRYGYRFIAPLNLVEAKSDRADEGTGNSPPGAGMDRQAQRRWPGRATIGLIAIALAGAAIALAWFLFYRSAARGQVRSAWVQITNFPDSATSPSLSPDGRMITFIRGPDTFVGRGQIYVKMLPDGQPVQLTHDDSPKMAPVFSPDGSRIAYTATDASFGWSVWVVPVLGGEPRRLLPNAAALTWADRRHVMFSESNAVFSMNVVTALESREGERAVYVPSDASWMAHRSWVSPDGRWVLISEMNRVGWQPCRLLPFDGSTRGETVGPTTASCTYAGWSPDGKMMYFSADAGDGYHIWRQPFPKGVPEQITFGATEEEGIAISPDGSTLVTSAGIQESTVWYHDAKGDRQISGEGFANLPGLGFGSAGVPSVFSPNGRTLFYLVRKEGSRAFHPGELWMTDLDSGRTEAVLPGVSMSDLDIAPDGQRVVFTALDAGQTLRAWIAPLDRSTPPKQLTTAVARQPFFGHDGKVYFLSREGQQEFLSSVVPGESEPRKIDPAPITDFRGVSPDGDWWLTGITPLVAHSRQGGTDRVVCSSCGAGWGSGGKLFYLRFRDVGEMGGGRTIAISLPAGSELPVLPASGLETAKDAGGLHVVANVDMEGMTIFAPGPDPSVYAYVRKTVQRNLFQIPLK